MVWGSMFWVQTKSEIEKGIKARWPYGRGLKHKTIRARYKVHYDTVSDGRGFRSGWSDKLLNLYQL
jgi:hypothetical protein